MDEKYFYDRKLPHWQPPEGTYFITYRLAGSIPVSIINTLMENYVYQKSLPENQSDISKKILREEYFNNFDIELEGNLNDPHWLKNENIAKLVMTSLLFYNNKQYTIWSVCIMSNHVHVVLTLLQGSQLLNKILQSHKRFTAVEANKLLQRSGAFWAEESYDTIIRNDLHFYRSVNYCIQNPVKAGLVRIWSDWCWTFIHPELEEDFKLVSQ
jgi:putative transposase